MNWRVRLLLCVALLWASSVACASGTLTVPWRPSQIITTFWSAPPTEKRYLEQLKREHFNLTWSNEGGLTEVRKSGLKAILLEQAVINLHCLDSDASRAKLDALVARVKTNPALEMYFVHDEPTGAEIPMVARVVAYLRKLDPAHPAFVNLLPCYASNQQLGAPLISFSAYPDYVRRYIDLVKPALVSYDHYHFYNGSDSSRYFENLSTISGAAKKAGIPFLNVIQAARFTPRWRLMTERELRWMAYTTLAYGGSGIAYFLYWGPSSQGGLYRDGKPTLLANEVATLNADLARLSPTFTKLDYEKTDINSSSKVKGRVVTGWFTGNGGKRYALVANKSHSDQSFCSFDSSFRAVRVFDLPTLTWRTVNLPQNRRYEINPGDARLFAFDD